MKLLHILATAYGFKTYFFWQPVLAFGAKPLVPFKQELEKARSEEPGDEFTAVLKSSIRRRKLVRQPPRVLSSWAMSLTEYGDQFISTSST